MYIVYRMPILDVLLTCIKDKKAWFITLCVIHTCTVYVLIYTCNYTYCTCTNYEFSQTL